MPEASVQSLIPRPKGISGISDEALMAAVREYMLGAKPADVAIRLGVPVNEFYWVVRQPAWRVLQNHFRDEFVATEGGRMARLQNMVLDKLEEYVDEGITCWGQDKLGVTFSYQRELMPKELTSIALMLNTENKRLDAVKEGDIDRKSFDPQGRMRKLEAIARKMQEKEIPGESSREAE